MADAKTPGSVSPELRKVAERAKRNPEQRILALAQLIDVPALERAYRRLRKEAAEGVDGVTVEQYGQDLPRKLQTLHERLKSGRYRHQPIRRVHIPKESGKARPIGISTVEDKCVQGALREVLEAIYEQEFLDCSYGFRPRRSAHDALKALYDEMGRGGCFVLEADIVSFFDSIDRKVLMEMLRGRIADESLMRLVGKCLRVGVLDGEQYSEPEIGTAQGSALSPLLGNIYLHHALDSWFERVVKPRLRTWAVLVRYADDFVMCFGDEADARRVAVALSHRMARYGLSLHPEKTRLFAFHPPSGGHGKGSATFDFLGFTLHWQRKHRGGWRLGCRTRRVRLRRAIRAVTDWCRGHRHWPLEQQHATLSRKLAGHYNYYGVSGNTRSLWGLYERATLSWRRALVRQSQRSRVTWKRFLAILARYPLPRPRVSVRLWGFDREPYLRKSRMVETS